LSFYGDLHTATTVLARLHLRIRTRITDCSIHSIVVDSTTSAGAGGVAHVAPDGHNQRPQVRVLQSGQPAGEAAPDPIPRAPTVTAITAQNAARRCPICTLRFLLLVLFNSLSDKDHDADGREQPPHLAHALEEGCARPRARRPLVQRSRQAEPDEHWDRAVNDRREPCPARAMWRRGAGTWECSAIRTRDLPRADADGRLIGSARWQRT
jgi:hypothetical protein